MPDPEQRQYVVGSPEWRVRQLDMRRRHIALTVEMAYQRERREFARSGAWLGLACVGAAFVYGISFTIGARSGIGRLWMAQGPPWVVEFKNLLLGILIIAGILMVLVGPFGFFASLIRWIGAIKDRRRAMYPADHPDLELGMGSPERPVTR